MASARFIAVVSVRFAGVRLPSLSFSGCTAVGIAVNISAPLCARYAARTRLAAIPALRLNGAPGSGLKSATGAASVNAAVFNAADPVCAASNPTSAPTVTLLAPFTGAISA